jgi:hypothetical protein
MHRTWQVTFLLLLRVSFCTTHAFLLFFLKKKKKGGLVVWQDIVLLLLLVTFCTTWAFFDVVIKNSLSKRDLWVDQSGKT